MATIFKQDGIMEQEVERVLDGEERWALALTRFARSVRLRLQRDPYLTLAVAAGCGFVLSRGFWAYLLGAASRVTVAAALRPLIDEWHRAERTNH